MSSVVEHLGDGHADGPRMRDARDCYRHRYRCEPLSWIGYVRA